MTQLSAANESVTLIAQATFGRDSAMFEGLLGFVAQLSVVLWALVILTVIMRFVGVAMYRRGARRRAARAAAAVTPAPLAAIPAPAMPASAAVMALVPPAAVQLTDAVVLPAEFAEGVLEGVLADALPADAAAKATFGEVLHPAAAPAVATSMNIQHRGTHNWRSEPKSASHLPALASNSTEV
ncbi:hypothetical protein [Pseudarthrobacter sulfonivorans]|uniref:hypothetical protein n=1 Tax=Pseudarthrobacter sulfonivorans TaxID=121292 RepID=UPI002103F797|nr:hypothetical protein [Pseudarthrobacter sulfonivorans]